MKRAAATRHRLRARPLTVLLVVVALVGVVALLLSGQRAGGAPGAGGRRWLEQQSQVGGAWGTADQPASTDQVPLHWHSQGGKPSWCEPEYPG